jgi:hypothetical protein
MLATKVEKLFGAFSAVSPSNISSDAPGFCVSDTACEAGRSGAEWTLNPDGEIFLGADPF